LLPSRSINSISPPLTLLLPRFTFASDGNPWRRLLIGSKGPFGVVFAGHSHSFDQVSNTASVNARHLERAVENHGIAAINERAALL
jgi:hypothetical protein